MKKAQYTTSSRAFTKDASVKNNTFVYARRVGGVLLTQEQPLTYKRLQRACRALGIPHTASANTLRKRLWQAEHGARVPATTPLTRHQRQVRVEAECAFDFSSAYAMDTAVSYEPVAEPLPVEVQAPEPVTKTIAKPKAIKLSSIGLSYRDSQAFVSWWRSEDRLTMPCPNTGWENVERNIEFILNQPRFWGWAATAHGQAALAAMGVSI